MRDVFGRVSSCSHLRDNVATVAFDRDRQVIRNLQIAFDAGGNVEPLHARAKQFDPRLGSNLIVLSVSILLFQFVLSDLSGLT